MERVAQTRLKKKINKPPIENSSLDESMKHPFVQTRTASAIVQ
jgi:hypothetical protein